MINARALAVLNRRACAAVVALLLILSGIAPAQALLGLLPLPPLPGSLIVTITSPAAGSTVSGTTTVNASVSIVGSLTVAGVQFKLDGADLGAEDRGAPYSISWNTTATSNGTHRLTAVARDALGIQYVSDPVTVTVSNAPPPPPLDTTSPSVNVSSPASGSTVSGTITVSASASDNVGVAGVRFFMDGAMLGAEDTAAPYSVSWDTTTAANGSHTLTAVARDAAGNTATSSPVMVTVSNGPPPDATPPSVTITSPGDGATVSGAVTVSASASDNVGVAGVRFMVDGVALGAEDTTAPYSIVWDTTATSDGSHTLTALARDVAGNIAYSSPVTVTVSNAPPPDATPPSVGITAPASGATVSGTITVSADASDNVGVAGVQFRLDGVNLGTEDTTAPYSIAWDTTATSDGSHSLTAVARDAANNVATSSAVTVTVSNAAPPPPPPPPPGVTRIEDTDASVIYSGDWSHGDASRSWSGGTTSYSRGPGASVGLTFSGTQVTWIGWRSPQAGIARVSLDGVLVAEVDLFSTTEAVQAPVFTSDVLAAGTHTLTIEVTGTANPSATDSIVAVDAFDVTSGGGEPPPPPPGMTRVEDTDPSVSYAGTWLRGNTARAWSGGKASLARGPDGADPTPPRATFAFSGTRVTWIGYRGPLGGIARVFLDGAFVAEIDLFASTETIQAPVFTSDVMAAGSHSLAIEATGRANPSATDTVVVVDAFDVTSSGAPPPPPQGTTTRLEETDPAIVYSGAWIPDSSYGPWSGGTAVYTVSAGAQATFTFSGTGVSWIGYRGRYGGIVRVYLDGALASEIDTYSATEEVSVAVYSATGLAAGTHSLRVELTGMSNPSATNSEMAVDAFDVTR